MRIRRRCIGTFIFVLAIWLPRHLAVWLLHGVGSHGKADEEAVGCASGREERDAVKLLVTTILKL